MLIIYILMLLNTDLLIYAYKNNLFYLVDMNVNVSDLDCGLGVSSGGNLQQTPRPLNQSYNNLKLNFSTIANKVHLRVEEDPLKGFNAAINRVLFGGKTRYGEIDSKADAEVSAVPIDSLAHFPSGAVMRAEIFQNKSGVHLPQASWMHRGYCYLNITKDYMQTAVNAFAIFLHGNLDDVLRLPPMYVLKSARTISMMKIAREKIVATWTVVKGDHETDEISYQTLELYRPLFKYVNGKEMARLNLEDERILSYVGTHAELDRHQVGIIASRYIQINPKWREPRYLNLMNNLLCGVPMNFMRRVPEHTYLQLSHQLFYHIKACDPLQRRFYLAMMTRTQVLGKSNSWGARDVARLGLLLTEVDGPELSAINPEAMVGITAQVMTEMSARNLKFVTKMQLRYLSQLSLNILTRKLNIYEADMKILNSVTTLRAKLCIIIIPCITIITKNVYAINCLY